MSEKEKQATPPELKGVPKEVLHCTVKINGEDIELDLPADLCLGEGREDPFVVAQALDDHPAQVASWSLAEMKAAEAFKDAESMFNVLCSELQLKVKEKISKQFQEKNLKPPTVADLEAAFQKYFDKFWYMKKKGEEIPEDDKNLNRYLEMREKKEAAEKNYKLIQIVAGAWAKRSYTLNGLASLLMAMMQAECLVVKVKHEVTSKGTKKKKAGSIS